MGFSPVIRLDGGNSCSELRFDVKALFTMGLLLAEHLPHVVLRRLVGEVERPLAVLRVHLHHPYAFSSSIVHGRPTEELTGAHAHVRAAC
jgi:hypothetical protein